MTTQGSLLGLLQSTSQVDCDTLDCEGHCCSNSMIDIKESHFITVPRKYGNLVDCTSNQVRRMCSSMKNALTKSKAIAYTELQKPQHEALIKESITVSEQLFDPSRRITKDELAAEIAVITTVLILLFSDTPISDGQIVATSRPAYQWDGSYADKSTPCIQHRGYCF